MKSGVLKGSKIEEQVRAKFNPNYNTRRSAKKIVLLKGQTLREYIKAQVKTDPLVVQDRRIIWEKFYKYLP